MSVQLALSLLGLDGYYIIGEPTNEEEYNSMLTMTNGENNNISWNQVQQALGEGGAVPMHFLRVERDILLSQTDWVVTKATETNSTVSNEWKTYRQALRDLPSTQTNARWSEGVLSNVTFPTKPTD